MQVRAHSRPLAPSALLDQSGFAMPIAIIVLFIVTALTGAAILVGTQSSGSTTRESNVKAELAAAEAGLHMASYRLGQLKPSETQCIGEGKDETEESKCKDATESLGNGASFRYKTTKPLKAGEECSGRKLESVPSNTVYRCVTAEGIVNGVEPVVRLQARVKASGGETLFPIKGVLGLKKVLVNGSVTVPALVASNGEIRGEGSANFSRGFEICAPEGKFKPAAGSERNSSGVKVHGVGGSESAGPEWEKTRNASECPIKAPVPSGHATAESNEDSTIAAKLKGSHHTWSEKTYEFSLEGSESEDILTLGEAGKTSKYFFCSFSVTNGVLKIASGAKVEIYIGNSEETSKCAAKTGKIEIANGAKTENLSKNPADLLIVVGGKGPFVFANGSGKVLEASIYAPNAKVEVSGGVEFKGGIVGSEVLLEGGSKFYEWSEETATLTNGSASAYGRETWEQCVSGSSGSC